MLSFVIPEKNFGAFRVTCNQGALSPNLDLLVYAKWFVFACMSKVSSLYLTI